MTSNHIILIAGETSGDIHGAHLVEALKGLNPSLTFSGFGGPEMEKAGVKLYQDLTKLAVVGFVEVIKHYGEFKKAFNLILDKIEEKKPAAVILIDYPGFNLRLAKKLKKFDTKVIYYISPQIWAWKKNRVYDIKKYIDKMLVIFEFEKNLYEKYGVDAEFVGHPLVDSIDADELKRDFFENSTLDDYKNIIGLLPGSRQKEIEKLLPVMLKSMALLHKKFPMLQCFILKAPHIKQSLIEQYCQNYKFKYEIIEGNPYEAIGSSKICLVASGTATLETAIIGTPMVVIYKTSFLTWTLAKCFVKIRNIGLVNIVAQKQIVPECIQYQAKPAVITKHAHKMLTDDEYFQNIKDELLKVRQSLGNRGANKKAAQAIIDCITQ